VLFKQEYDTIYNKENERKVTGLQMQYEFSKQQDSIRAEQLKKDALAQQQIQRQKAFTDIGAAGFILLTTLLFFVYRNYIYQRKATEAMALARARAEQSEKFKEKFLANMSHEIRTPMNAVLGMANLVLDTSLNDKQKNYISAIKKSSENLLVILNDILELSKLEAGKMHLEKLPFHLREQVNHVMDIMRFKADEKGLQFTAKVADDVPAVLNGDATRLSEVLFNLLGNAIKFTSKGFVKLEVTVVNSNAQIPTSAVQPSQAETDSCSLEFKIKDTGIGMTEEQQQRIFESFVQGDADISRKYGGTGLGLAISKTLIELQGGSICVKSEAGKASEFTIIIPYQTASESDIVKPEEKKEEDYSALKKLKVLIVEDNDFNQVVIKDTLENLAPGISVSIAANGKIAVEMMPQLGFDMILMDVHMPEMDGYEATRFIRNNLKINIPIIALTASVIRGDLDKCTEAGMNGYIPKPFKREELLDELIKHLPNSKTNV
jgi:signal transduction histidine kinase/ActR/RegA family two-component response regulator